MDLELDRPLQATRVSAPSAYAGQRVVILGLARQGVALARHLAQAGARVVVSDLRTAEQLADSLAALSPLRIEYALGGHPASLLDGADLLCLSGGVDAHGALAEEARRRGIRLSNDSQIFLEACPAVETIGLTGSAGKTTTTTLVGRMLQPAPGRRVWVGGNIGNPLISDLERMEADDLVVMELSSFQLEIMTRSVRVGAVLNITPNHLDRHGTMEAYVAAKSNLVRHQPAGGVTVLGLDDPGARALAPLAAGRVAWFSGAAEVDEGTFLRGESLVWRWDGREQVVGALADVELRGRHNLLNVLAACAVSGAVGATPEMMRQALAGFAGVEHRLEFVRARAGVRWYNDSIASAPERVMAALHSFDEPLVALLGGRDKDLPWGPLAELAVKRLKRAILFGEARGLIRRALEAAGAPAGLIVECGTLAEAVAAAARESAAGDVVLLSPGGTSFDAFKDFADRGEQFKQWVNAL